MIGKQNTKCLFPKLSKTTLLSVGGVAFALVVWQLIVSLGLVNKLFLPSPTNVLLAFAREWPYVLSSTLITIGDIAIGFSVGVSLALVLGVTFGWYRKLGSFLGPSLLIISPIPIVTFVPLFILWFGLGKPPVILCGILGAFFPTFLNSMSGVRHADVSLIEVAQNFHANNRTILWKVVLPSASPHIINGLRISMQMAFLITPVAEMIMGDIGLGGLIWRSADLFNTELVLVGQLTLGLMGLTLYKVFDHMETNFLLRWRRPRNQNGN